MLNAIILILKGLAMGAANVIPGVSGGTIALITGIFERLIVAIKKVDATTLKLLFQLKWGTLWDRQDAPFLLWLGVGIGLSIFSLARLFEWLLVEQETLTMAFFFGLILASVFYVGRTVSQWNPSNVGFLVLGTGIALSIAFLVPAQENANPLYVFLCGVIAVCSMILPGLSGSFVMILMGNYALVLRAISTFDFSILLPLALGCGFGILAFAQLLAWVFKRFHNQTLAVMTGFVVGSLATIWPWKAAQIEVLQVNGETREIITGYQWFVPNFSETNSQIAIACIVLGAAILILSEYFAAKIGKKTKS